MNGEELIVAVTFFMAIGFLMWKWLDSRHKQRMAIVERGMLPADFENALRRAGSPLPTLKWGLLAIFVGTGLLIGIIMNLTLRVDEAITPVLALIMGGVALLVYYRVAEKKLGN